MNKGYIVTGQLYERDEDHDHPDDMCDSLMHPRSAHSLPIIGLHNIQVDVKGQQ